MLLTLCTSSGKITTMKMTQTIKVTIETLKNLRMLHALTGETMQAILERLVKAELERVQQDGNS